MSHEYFNNLSNPVKLSGYAGNIAPAFKSEQRSRHQSRQMARFPSSKRRQITNRDKNHDTLSRFGVMQATSPPNRDSGHGSTINNMFPKSVSGTYTNHTTFNGLEDRSAIK